MKFTVSDSDNDGDYTPAATVARKPRRKPRIFTVKLAPQAVIEWYKISLDKKMARRNSTIKEEAIGHLLAMGWKIYPIQKKIREELRYESPKGRVYISLRTACKGYIDLANAAASTPPPVGEEETVKSSSIKRKYLKPAAVAPITATFNEGKESLLSKPEKCVKSPSEKWGKKKPTAWATRNPRTALYYLVEQGIISPGVKVYYKLEKSVNEDPLTAWGTITKGGLIECDCCKIPFSISKFEVHTGSTKHRPAANIFLEDGRSLQDCQKLLFITAQNRKDFQKVKKSLNSDKNDSVCSICNFGGELILCDLCPATFHSTCLGFHGIPVGDWFCPSCCCKICGQFHYNSDGVCSNYSSFIKCVQCEQNVHIGCVIDPSNQPTDKHNWFCSKTCNDIHFHLRNLLWKQTPSRKDQTLTWTLMKHSNSITENHKKKLHAALDVIRESFPSVKDPVTEADIVRGVVFSRRSKVKRLSFEGFYTMVLEMNDVATTVATVRVYGDRVAEVPFVATRLEYRRRGLCRTLMNELESQLRKLGVKRLTLPAVDEALDTWTTGFGFSKMSDSEKLELLNYTFLGFQDTVRCHKNLEKKKINNNPNDLELKPRKKLKQTDSLEKDFFDYMYLDSWNSISGAF